LAVGCSAVRGPRGCGTPKKREAIYEGAFAAILTGITAMLNPVPVQNTEGPSHSNRF
jgi:hypothetical protein